MKKNKQKKKHAHLHDIATEKSAMAAQRQIVQTFKSKFNAKRSWVDRLADFMTEQFGTFWFFVFNVIWYVVWFTWNAGIIPGLPIIDPYPHSFLTMIVSLEAIFLSIIVLISQNRASSIAELREEIDFNINVRAEKEITKILNMVDKIHDHLGLENENDDELNFMKKETNLDEIEALIEKEYNSRKR